MGSRSLGGTIHFGMGKARHEEFGGGCREKMRSRESVGSVEFGVFAGVFEDLKVWNLWEVWKVWESLHSDS